MTSTPLNTSLDGKVYDLVPTQYVEFLDKADWRKSIGASGPVGPRRRYALVGILALVALERPEGSTTDTRGAMRSLLQQPMGYTLLTLIALGLFCYAVFRLVCGVFD